MSVRPHGGERSAHQGAFLGYIEIECDDPAEVEAFWAAVSAISLPWERTTGAGEPVAERVSVDLYASSEDGARQLLIAEGAHQILRSGDSDDPFVVLAGPDRGAFWLIRVSSDSTSAA